MGAEHLLDLTSEVTHLIVGELQTPKYKFVAREREDVVCLHIDWVYAVREQFLSGAELELEELEQRYKIPTLWNLEICITGFENSDQRKEIENQIAQNGGQYRGDLRKDCTHLICFSPVGAKYTSANAWGIHCVSIEWLTMSIQRGLVLDETYFKPTMLPSERGKGAWIRKTSAEVDTLKRERTDSHIGQSRKLRRTASARFSTGNLWGDIVSAAPSPALKPSESFASAMPLDVSAEDNGQAPAREAPGRQRLSRSESLASHQGQSGVDTASVPEFQRAGIFHGKHFLIHGFEQRKVRLLEQHLKAHDAQTFDDAEQFQQSTSSSTPDSSFTLVPYTSSPDELNSKIQTDKGKCVTELWLEKCLHEKRCISPTSSAAYTPFRHPLPGFEKLTISSTGLDGVDLMHVSKTVKLLGATYSEGLNPSTSILVCKDSSLGRMKVKRAIQWRIPALDVRWLWECVQKGCNEPYKEYLIHPQMQQADESRQAAKQNSASETTKGALQSKQLLGRSISNLADARPPSLVVRDSFAGRSDVGNEEQSHLPSRQVVLSEALRGSESLPVTEPLNEVSPNIPPPRRLSNPPPSLKQGVVPPLGQLQRTAIGEDAVALALTSLLTKAREQSHSPRKTRRTLLGRARSDLSTRSLGSRAGSVDSMNTDGLGTPLEPAFKYSPAKSRGKAGSRLADGCGSDDDDNKDTNGDNGRESLTAELLRSHEEIEAEKEKLLLNEATPAMTQVGYDDSEARLYRGVLARKMAGGADAAREPTSPELERELESLRSRRQGRLQDEGGQSISARTRHNRG